MKSRLSVLLLKLLIALPAGNVFATTLSYSYTGSVQSFVVPSGVSSLSFSLKGASGGDASGGGWTVYGGRGAQITGTLSVSAGSTLYIYVGGAGTDATQASVLGGFNGGGKGQQYSGGGGGGATDIRIGGTALTNRVAVASGGGGANTVGGYGGEGGNSASSTYNNTLGQGSDGVGGGGGGGYFGGNGAVYGYHGNASGGSAWASSNGITDYSLFVGGNGNVGTKADGLASITYTAVPEPSTISLLLLSLVGVGTFLYRKRKIHRS